MNFSIKTFIKKVLRERLGYDIHRIRQSQHEDPFCEQYILLRDVINPVIFDVGANVGNTVMKYKNIFPNSKIHAFEPFQESFDILKNNTSTLCNIYYNQCGLADISGIRRLHINRVPSTNSLLPSSQNALNGKDDKRFETKDTIEISLNTLDNYTQQNGIEQIDLLKLDVQGAEPLIIQGAQDLLERNKIHIIFTEIMVTEFYQSQQPLHEALAMYDRLGFKLYNFYDLSAFEGPLRQLDAIFIRKNT